MLLLLLLSLQAASSRYCSGGELPVKNYPNGLNVWPTIGNLYFGGIGGLSWVDPISWQTQNSYQFTTNAQFQLVDDGRKFAWLQTATGLASLDLEQSNPQPVFTDIKYQDDQSTCPGDIRY